MLQLLVVLVIFSHGIGHIMGFLESWTSVNVGFTPRALVFAEGVTIESPIGRAFGVIWLVAMAGWIAVSAGLLLHLSWWEPLAIASAVISLAAILPWWNTVTPGARFGGTFINLATLALLSVPTWRAQVELLLR